MELKELLGEAYKSDMSLDEINKALAGKTFINEGVLENYVAKEEYEKLKKRADEASSEASDFKKKYRATLTDKEQLEVAQKEADSELQKKYEELLTKTKISEYKANYMAVGYDEKLANETANAMVNGDMETVFKNQGLFANNIEKSVKDKLLKETPAPRGGDSNGKELSVKDFRSMGVKELTELKANDPETFEKLAGQ